MGTEASLSGFTWAITRDQLIEAVTRSGILQLAKVSAETAATAIIAQLEVNPPDGNGGVTVSLQDLRTVVAMAADCARYDAKSADEEQSYARLRAAAGEDS